MRRSLAVLLAVFFASLSLVSLVTVVQAQAPSVALLHNATVTAAHEPITVSVKNGHESLTPTLLAEGAFTLPERLKLIGAVFRLGTTDTLPSQPPIIEARYPSLDMLDEQRLTLVYYDAQMEKWLPLKTVLDAVSHVATAEALAQDTMYALVVSPAAVVLPPNAVIVDDLDTTHFTRYGSAGAWHAVTGATDRYYLGHMYWTNNMTPGLTYTENMGIWKPVLSAGAYRVYAFIDWNNATTRNARYQIVHEGQTTIFPISQYDYVAEWASLGTYTFGADPTRNYVRLDDLTYESSFTKIGFDAIAFVPNKVFLPLVLKSEPIRIKSKAGIHLGNRSKDWNANMLNAIDGSKPGGIWPAMITVLSDQVYNLGRPQTGTGDNPYCHIVNVDPWRDQNGNPRKVYDYLKRAAQAGVKVVIRVNPSPGNFQDWDDPAHNNHHLISTDVPEGGGYCGYNGHQNKVRDVKDIAIEMQQIHAFNAREGWQEYAFEPANEPNTEWYSDTAGSVQRQHATAWREMDVYFSALYDQAKVLDPSIRILTPPMAQSAYAEPLEINSPITATVCDPRTVYDGPNPAGSGYDNMMATYTTKNDGFSWHNYWNQGREAWGNCPPTHHVYKVFPQWMKDQIRNSGKPSFITESDLSSPGQGMGNPMSNKNDPTTTADSIRQFIAAEVWGQNVVIWLINNNFADKPEYDWHEAFNDNDTPRSWFTQWWPGSEQWP